MSSDSHSLPALPVLHSTSVEVDEWSRLPVASDRHLPIVAKLRSLVEGQNCIGNLGVVLYVPELPRTIEKTVNYWRKGSREMGVQPIRVLPSPQTGKSLLPNYSQSSWICSGKRIPSFDSNG